MARTVRGTGRYPPPVRSAPTEVLAWEGERAQAGPWKGRSWGTHDRIAHLTPLHRGTTTAIMDPIGPGVDPVCVPSARFLRRCLETLAARGYTSVVTPALSVVEARAFAAVGFEEHERLLLLAHDLTNLSPRPAVRRHPIRSGHRGQVLALDATAFDVAWRLGEAGLDDALVATPSSRLRVALRQGSTSARPAVSGYAVSGRAGPHGYLQRLAVHPAHRREGLGSSLATDGLRWMRRHGAERAMVNTQPANEPALSLYLRLGFQLQPSDLRVLRFDLQP